MRSVYNNRVLKSRIARKLIALIIGLSALITLVMTGFQLLIDYRHDVKKIMEKIEDIRTAQIDTLRHSIWNLDEATIKLLLDSMLKIEGIEYLKLSSDQNIIWEAGRVESKKIISETFPIYHFTPEKMLIGKLQVTAGIDLIYKRLINRALIILATNALKTSLVAFFALAAFQMLVSRHLQHIASYVKQMRSDHYENELVLAGKKKNLKHPDEIDRIAIAINSMRLEQKTLVDGLKDEIKIREQAEATLGKSEDTFLHVFESANVGKSITSTTGELNANKAFSDLLGYTREELSNKTWQELTPLEEVETISKLISPLLSNEKDSIRFTKRYIHKNGSHIWADVSTAIQRNADGEPLHFITTLVDITDRKNAEKALKESESMFRALADQSITGIYMFQESRFLYVNHRFAEIFGYSVAEILTSLKPTDVVAPEEVRDAEKRIQARISGQEHNAHYRARGNRKDGAELWIEIYGTRIDLKGVPTITGTVLDITERRKTEKKSAEQLDELARWHAALVGREGRIIEIKQEVNELLARLGEPPRYASATKEGHSV